MHRERRRHLRRDTCSDDDEHNSLSGKEDEEDDNKVEAKEEEQQPQKAPQTVPQQPQSEPKPLVHDEPKVMPRRWLVAFVLALLGSIMFVLMLQYLQCPLIKDPTKLYAFSGSARMLWLASFAFIVLYAVIYTGSHP